MQLWLLPWTWEGEGTASKLLGVPAGETINVEQVETLLVDKLETRIEKPRQLALAARITVANSLFLGCLGYLLMMWAGKRCFLRKLQSIIDGFVCSGRSRVARVTVALPRFEGGLGLIGVEDQYHALTQNLTIWITAIGDHPLLQNHIKLVSASRWGTPDLSWLVSKSRWGGSALWQRICQGWAKLKKHLLPRLPVNTEEWGHRNHVDGGLVRCSTWAQQALRKDGFECMRDLQHPHGEFLTWNEARL